MQISIKAHFDGRSIIPDEPVDLPVNTPLSIHLDVPDNEHDGAEADAALQRLIARPIAGLQIPPESLRREGMYEER